MGMRIERTRATTSMVLIVGMLELWGRKLALKTTMTMARLRMRLRKLVARPLASLYSSNSRVAAVVMRKLAPRVKELTVSTVTIGPSIYCRMVVRHRAMKNRVR